LNFLKTFSLVYDYNASPVCAARCHSLVQFGARV
jgi:hypothetical protein